MLDDLRGLQGADFDQLYVVQQIKSHKEAVAIYRDYARHGDNSNLRAYAAQLLPTLGMHLRDAQDLPYAL